MSRESRMLAGILLVTIPALIRAARSGPRA